MYKEFTIPVCILLFVVFTTPAITEQPPDKGPGKKSDAPTFALMDCGNLDCGRDPQQVGEVISITSDSAPRRVLSLVTFLNSQGEEQTIGLSFQADQIPYQAEEGSLDGFCRNCVWFESGDCRETNTSEPGYIKAGPVKPFSETFKHFAVVGKNSQPDVRELWIATSDAVQEIVGDSALGATGQDCVQSGLQPGFVNPAELIDSDLHQTYPPPYTLERK